MNPMNGSAEGALEYADVHWIKPKMRNTSSSVWKYFSKSGINEAVCSICIKQFKTGGGTSNMRTHLKLRHPDIFVDEKPILMTKSKTEVIQEPELPEIELSVDEGDESIHDKETILISHVESVEPTGLVPKRPRKRKAKQTFRNASVLDSSFRSPMQTMYNTDSKDDKYDAAGRNVAYKLRDLPPDTAIITDKLISDILFEAAMGNITKHSRINIFELINNN